MKCKNCGHEIDNVWGFCPHCGDFAGGLEDSFMNIARMFGGKVVIKQEGDSFVVVLEIQGTRQAFRVTPVDLDELSHSPLPEPPELEEPPHVTRRFSRTEEPETDVNFAGDNLYIRVTLADVPEENVEIDRLEESIEVRAYKGRTRFFKLIPVPREYQLVSKEFLPGEAFIVLKKK
ncbi:MAG: zinc ribbon domain-containing protein [Theionarchaea archaeon]|nr:zinc ribbon domain-containing protein [Theionarchaea archaeon]MBU7001396.1 zinc ribbon domain-containing protein [Theionarchaea archaeon]MBU7021757.1 zinc ribbon domain-containing protein [Theionarchaea archaeon]MBU7034501.1 zinc ribbon domain-containing protein [Theionarchaea archaeon]MBU7040802.1 zinc ribbon domain-containing protein [Theionarchaea archaeon]